MSIEFDEIPRRILLDSSTLQTLQTYGQFLFEDRAIRAEDPICRDPSGVNKLTALRFVLKVAQRAPFEFVLSKSNLLEVKRRNSVPYLQWAHEVHGHWVRGGVASEPRDINASALAAVESASFNYLGDGDRALLRDAVALGCDTFLTMENKLPKASSHIRQHLGVRA